MKLRISPSPFLSVLFSLILLASSFTPAARAQDASGLDGVQAAYHDLLNLFYRPLDPRDLLRAGWTTLGANAERRGASAPGPLPDLPDDADAAFAVFSGAYSNYVSSLPPGFTPATAAADVETGMADSVHEQHTHYLPPAVMQRFLSTVGGGQQSIGLGIRLGGDPPGLIADVAPGGPAATAGLQSGDVIVAADGKDLSSTDTPSLVAALTGPEGSTVDLSIDRGTGPLTISVTRGPYYFPPLDSRVLPDGVGYLRLSDFVISGTTLPNGTELLADLDRRLDDFDAQGVNGLILDLRNNGGGSLQTTDELLGRFLPDTARSVHELDQRGHETFELAGGRLHARQLPMAVLINGGSASASEVTAAALHDAHRVVLVGQKTAGAVASSELLPLPGGGGIQIAVAAATAQSGAELDGVGVTPDITTPQSRSVADYRSGHDPQLDAAVAALANAPTPSASTAAPPAISPAELDRLLEAALPVTGEMSTNDRFSANNRWQRLDYIHPNELIDQNGGAPDPIALQQAMRARGYEGSVFASYGSTPGDLPTVSVNADLYATADGAHSAASTNDLPALQVPIEPPAHAGEETVAYRGAWLATGATLITWRRGRVVFTVTYADVPGFDRLDTVAAITQQVDARAQQLTIP
jgi:carboxyl-terminal processing protease